MSSLTASFYTLAPNHPDVEHGIDGGAVTGLVNATLSSGGLPTVSVFGADYSGPSGPITDVNGAGELQWWTAHGGIVSFASSSTVTLPFSQHLFPPPTFSFNGPPVGYTSARLDGSFNLPSAGSITINLGSDDDGWVFVDGSSSWTMAASTPTSWPRPRRRSSLPARIRSTCSSPTAMWWSCSSPSAPM